MLRCGSELERMSLFLLKHITRIRALHSMIAGQRYMQVNSMLALKAILSRSYLTSPQSGQSWLFLANTWQLQGPRNSLSPDIDVMERFDTKEFEQASQVISAVYNWGPCVERTHDDISLLPQTNSKRNCSSFKQFMLDTNELSPDDQST